jgi:hypothetical protein
MRPIARGQVLTAMIAATIAAAGLAACGTIPAPGGTPLASARASSATASSASVSPVATGSATPVTGPPITELPTAGTSSPEPTVAGRSLLTEADSEMTIVLPVGDEVTVVLGPPGMAMPWDQPTAHGGAVVRVTASAGYPTSVPARAVFKAVRPGTARLTSATDAKCLHLQATRCMLPQRIWEATVIVPAS